MICGSERKYALEISLSSGVLDIISEIGSTK